MKTIEINLYKFDELSDEGKERAITNNYDINVNYDWWEFTYMDAENIGVQITSFDCYTGKIAASFIDNAIDTANLIIANHGENTDSYLLATDYIKKRNEILTNMEDIVDDENSYAYELEGDMEQLNEQFLYDIKQEYLSILNKEYDYLTSEEQIKETLIVNDYDFTEDGDFFKR